MFFSFNLGIKLKNVVLDENASRMARFLTLMSRNSLTVSIAYRVLVIAKGPYLYFFLSLQEEYLGLYESTLFERVQPRLQYLFNNIDDIPDLRLVTYTFSI